MISGNKLCDNCISALLHLWSQPSNFANYCYKLLWHDVSGWQQGSNPYSDGDDRAAACTVIIADYP